MVPSVREFLETHALHERLSAPSRVGWNGQWPDEVAGHCRMCDAKRTHRLWPTKVAGLTREWGVYMLSGTCEKCGSSGLLFWVEVNEREGWIQKAGQLPAPAFAGHEASAA
jgi:hypothetical protein